MSPAQQTVYSHGSKVAHPIGGLCEHFFHFLALIYQETHTVGFPLVVLRTEKCAKNKLGFFEPVPSVLMNGLSTTIPSVWFCKRTLNRTCSNCLSARDRHVPLCRLLWCTSYSSLFWQERGWLSTYKLWPSSVLNFRSPYFRHCNLKSGHEVVVTSGYTMWHYHSNRNC